jgi:hypothetical protein
MDSAIDAAYCLFWKTNYDSCMFKMFAILVALAGLALFGVTLYVFWVVLLPASGYGAFCVLLAALCAWAGFQYLRLLLRA